MRMIDGRSSGTSRWAMPRGASATTTSSAGAAASGVVVSAASPGACAVSGNAGASTASGSTSMESGEPSSISRLGCASKAAPQTLHCTQPWAASSWSAPRRNTLAHCGQVVR